MTAARAGSIDTTKLLASRGANVNARESWFGETALMWAAAENHADMIRTLVALGAEINARSSVVNAPELEFPKSGGPNMPFARGGWSALMYAGSRRRAIDTARALVDLKADVNLVRCRRPPTLRSPTRSGRASQTHRHDGLVYR